MKFYKFDYILAVAEEKSFTKAAKKLFISQPSLSQYIQNVEKELNIQIFNRSVSPLELTDAGKLFIKTAKQITQLQLDLKNQLLDLDNLHSGNLSIGSTPFRSTCILPSVLTTFRNQFPNVKVSVMTAVTPELIKSSIDGKIHIFTAKESSVNKNQFDYQHICNELILLAVPQNNNINKKFKRYSIPVENIVRNKLGKEQVERIPLGYFQSETFLQSSPSQDLHHFLLNLCQRASFKPNIFLQTQNVESIFAMTVAGLGLSFIPCTYIRFGNILKHPVYYCIDDDFTYRSFGIAYLKNRYISNSAKSFIALLKDVMK